MNRFLRKSADRSARDLTRGFAVKQDGSYVSQLLAAGVEHQREKRHHMAEDAYGKVLAQEPENADALYLMGTLKLLYRDFEAASELLQKAVDIAGESAKVWTAYGSALEGLGRHEEAIMGFQRALELEPSLADAHYHLAQLHRNLREWGNAVVHYRRAVGYDPGHAQAYNELAECYFEKGEYDESMSACHSALLIDKRLSPAYNNLGRALAALGQTTSAEESFRQAIRLDPGYAAAYGNLGAAFLDLGKPAQALEACIQATQLDDSLGAAHCTRGEALRRLGRLDEAMQSCQRAIAVDPEGADALATLAQVYLDSSLVDESVAAFRRALAVRREHRGATSALVDALKCQPSARADEVREAAAQWGKVFGWSSFTAPELRGPVRRVGFLTGPLEETPAGSQLDALLAGWRGEFAQVYVYVNSGSSGPQTERIEKSAAKVRRTVGLDDLTVTSIVHEDEIDVLVDLAGHGEGGRLGVLAQGAAPVQLTWFGGAGTTGLVQVSGILADGWSLPVGEEGSVTEEVYRMSGPSFGFMPPDVEAHLDVPPCTNEEPFTFGSFNQTKKIGKQTVAVWSEILRRVPGSRLLIKSKNLASGALRRQYLAWFRAQDIDPERIILRQWTTRQAHFASYNQVDVCLDTFPCTGAVTTLESLWMGVPVVSLASPGVWGRQSEAALRCLGMGDLVASDVDGYIDCAVALTTDSVMLAKLRKELRNRMMLSPICDRAAFAERFWEVIRGFGVRGQVEPGGSGLVDASRGAVLGVGNVKSSDGAGLVCEVEVGAEAS